MLFVSRITNLVLIVRNARVQRGENEEGQFVSREIRPQLEVNFREKSLTEAQRAIAVRQFTELNPQFPWGAAPYAIGGVMGQEYGDMIMGDEQYQGYDPAFNLGMFNTTKHIDYDRQHCETDEECAELKALVEATLLDCSAFNVDYILLDSTLPKPWANYPNTVEDAGAVAKIISLAPEIGVSLQECLDYEIVKDPISQQAITALKAELAKQDAAARERAALSETV